MVSCVGLIFFSACAQRDGVTDTGKANLPVHPLPEEGSIVASVQKFKPALAVRGISCMLCHAQVQSNLITDFGYGDAQFFVGQDGQAIYRGNPFIRADRPLTLPWYGDYYGTWQLMDRMNGTLIVPKATLSDATLLKSINKTAPVSFADLLKLDLGNDYYGDVGYSGAGPLLSVVQPVANRAKVQEMGTVYIGAPTADQLLLLTKTLSATSVGSEAVGSGSSITGLVVRTGTGGSYVTNDPAVALHCQGDVVVKGTLFLDDVTIDTDTNGCRLMATQSIFIDGRVRYSSTSGNQNLQLSSAEAILMGFSTSSLATRLGSWYPDAQPLTRGVGSNSDKVRSILAEAAVIGSPLHDSTESAQCPTSMVTYVGHNGHGDAQTLTQCGIDYSRLLLNAPNIQSRYVGHFKGVVIAEIALFAPGALDFTYDSTFDSVDILPQLGNAILSVKP